MKPATNLWPNTTLARHILFIAQSMREVIDQKTFESFRLQTLDLLSRIKEVINLLEQLEEGHVRRATVLPALAELNHSLSIDPLTGLIPQYELAEYQKVIQSFKKGGDFDPKQLKQLSIFVISQFDENYKRALESELIASVDKPHERQRLRRLIQAYFAYLVNSGYSKPHISKEIERVFFSNDVRRADARFLKKFLARFDGEIHEYDVAIPVRQGTIGFLGTLSVERFKPRKVHQLPMHFQKSISNTHGVSPKDRYFIVDGNACDAHGAAEEAKRVLRILASTTTLETNGIRILERNFAFVGEKGKRTVRQVKVSSNKLQNIQTFASKSKGERIFAYTRSVIGDFDPASQQRVLSALDSASLARYSGNVENQITLLWSAMEILFGDPPESSSRISYYSSAIVPCLCLNYAWRVANAIHKDLRQHHRHSLDDALDQANVPNSGSQIDRFVRFVFDPKFAPQHLLLLNRIESNPLALNRLHRFYEKFRTPANFRRALADHETRTNWQLSRIYRLRNEFVHAGKKYNFSSSLSLNSFEYFRTSLLAIIFRAQNDNYKRPVDFHTSAIRLSYLARISELEDHSSQDESTDEILKYFQRC